MMIIGIIAQSNILKESEAVKSLSPRIVEILLVLLSLQAGSSFESSSGTIAKLMHVGALFFTLSLSHLFSKNDPMKRFSHQKSILLMLASLWAGMALYQGHYTFILTGAFITLTAAGLAIQAYHHYQVKNATDTSLWLIFAIGFDGFTDLCHSTYLFCKTIGGPIRFVDFVRFIFSAATENNQLMLYAFGSIAYLLAMLCIATLTPLILWQIIRSRDTGLSTEQKEDHQIFSKVP